MGLLRVTSTQVLSASESMRVTAHSEGDVQDVQIAFTMSGTFNEEEGRIDYPDVAEGDELQVSWSFGTKADRLVAVDGIDTNAAN